MIGEHENAPRICITLLYCAVMLQTPMTSRFARIRCWAGLSLLKEITAVSIPTASITNSAAGHENGVSAWYGFFSGFKTSEIWSQIYGQAKEKIHQTQNYQNKIGCQDCRFERVQVSIWTRRTKKCKLSGRCGWHMSWAGVLITLDIIRSNRSIKLSLECKEIAESRSETESFNLWTGAISEIKILSVGR